MFLMFGLPCVFGGGGGGRGKGAGEGEGFANVYEFVCVFLSLLL